MKIKRLELTLFLLLAVLTAYSAAVSLRQRAMAGEVVRLRVVANSDAFIDQSRKLLVRDAVLEACAALIPEAADATDARAALENHLDELAETAARAAGGSTPVFVRLAEGSYPTRTYRDFSLPAGRYVGLQVYLGEGQGKNWWCVVYPSLCGGAAMADDPQCDETTFAFKSAEWVSALCGKIWS